MKRLFMCYPNASRSDVNELAAEIRLRGVPVWLDHDSGFRLGDNCQTEARRVIADQSETFGLMFYATPNVFDSDFIKTIELHEAVQRMDCDPGFRLTAVLRGIDFKTLSEQSICHLGVDLSAFHSSVLPAPKRKVELPPRGDLAATAVNVLKDRLSIMRTEGGVQETVGVNLCTRDCLLPSEDDHLWIDATRLFTDEAACSDNWARLICALEDVKRELRSVVPRPKIRLRGSKHLTAGFLFGRTFTPSVAGELIVQQGADLWSSSIKAAGDEALRVQLEDAPPNDDRRLFVGLTATDKPIRAAVRGYVALEHIKPMATLWLELDEAHSGSIDNGTAVAIAEQARREIIEAVRTRGAKEIFLFMAVPQAVAVFLGHKLNATLPVQLHEYDGIRYRASARWPVDG